jgi:hypothetical protein
VAFFFGARYTGESAGVFSQGETLEELRENIQDAYDLMVTQERSSAPATASSSPLAVRRARPAKAHQRNVVVLVAAIGELPDGLDHPLTERPE